MPTVDVERTKRADVLQLIADARFSYPTAENPDWEMVINHPSPELGVQIRGGGWIYPDIVVTEEPGHFIQVLAVVALRHEVTEAEAVARWLPLSKAGSLFLYVPAGQAGRTNTLCRQLGIRVAGIRAWKRTPTYGIELVDTYSGPDIVGVVASLLPEFLRPRAYRTPRIRLQEAYRAPALAQQERELPEPEAVPELAAPALAVTPAGAAEAEVLPGGVHLPPPSVKPIMIGLGLMMTAFGVIFPAELLGAGLTMTVMGVLGWLGEDVQYFGGGEHDEVVEVASEELPGGVHLPPPSVKPIMIGLGLMMTAFGVIFPGELLGAGITMTGLGVLGWLGEDVQYFSGETHGEHA